MRCCAYVWLKGLPTEVKVGSPKKDNKCARLPAKHSNGQIKMSDIFSDPPTLTSGSFTSC